MSSQTNNKRALIYAIAAVAGWSTVATAFKLALESADVFQLLFYANLAAVLTLGAYVAITGQAQLLFRSFKMHWKITLIAGCLNPLLYYLLLFGAYDLLPAQVAMSINYSWAIVLTFMATLFLGQKILRTDWIAAFLCYFGVVIIAGGGRLDPELSVSGIGLLLAGLSTIAWAAYWTMNVRDPREPAIGLTLNFLVALPLTLACCLLISDLYLPLGGLAASVYVGVVEMGVGFLLWSLALRSTDNTSRVSNLIFLSPFLSLLFIYWLLGEAILPSTLMGLVIIISALLLQQYFHSQTGKLEKELTAPK